MGKDLSLSTELSWPVSCQYKATIFRRDRTNLWVMDECAALAVRWELSRGSILEALDDSLAPAVSLVSKLHLDRIKLRTVFPDPLYPTISVKGVLN